MLRLEAAMLVAASVARVWGLEMSTFIWPKQPVVLSGGATEATQLDVLAEVTAINANTTDVSTETTLSALNAKVTAVDTGAVVVSSSVLPTGAATESTLSSLNAKVTAVNTGAVVVSSSALPSGAATEATLSALESKAASAMVNEPFDEQVIAYVGATDKIDTITYKLSGVTQAVQTFSYDGSDRLTGIVKS